MQHKRFGQYFLLYTGAVLYIHMNFCWAIVGAQDDTDDPIDTDPSLPILISSILNNLTAIDRYDKRLRPDYGMNPVDVGITIHVSSISAVSEVQMDYTLDIYLRQMWTDRRLAFRSKTAGPSANRDLTIGVQYMKSIWVPDTFFPNEKSSFFHTATTHNSFLRITPDGEVLTSQRLTVTATCPMELQLFPLDSQECTLEIESYGYSTADIRYRWFKGKSSVTLSDQAKVLPQFIMTGFDIQEKIVELSTGAYSRLICKYIFTRSIGYYLIQIYLPAMLIVVISWVSFWLSRDATPARVSLGVTTVLTMTTLMTTTNSAMPKVSYIKSIDIFLITSFFMVFSSLIEYAAVGYLNKKLRMYRERSKSKMNLPVTAPVITNQAQSKPSVVFSATSGLGGKGESPVAMRHLLGDPGPNHEPRRTMGTNYGTLGTQPSTLAVTGGYNSNQTHLLSPQGVPHMPQQQKLQQYQQPQNDYDLERVPMQTNVQSDGYTVRDIIMCWNITTDNFKGSVLVPDDLRLPEFSIVSYYVIQTEAGTSTGMYSRLRLKFIFERSIGFYLIQIYLPSVLIVIISWVSFWLSRDATPARVSLGVTTVLAMTTVMTTTNSSMPKVSYIKSIDIYLGVCFIMVFASLLEYAAAGYLNKRLRMRKEKKVKPMSNMHGRPVHNANTGEYTLPSQNMLPPPMTVRIPGMPGSSAMPYHEPMQSPYSAASRHRGPVHPLRPFDEVECDCDLEGLKQIPIQQYQQLVPLQSTVSQSYLNPNSVISAPTTIRVHPTKKSRRRWCGVSPSDGYSTAEMALQWHKYDNSTEPPVSFEDRSTSNFYMSDVMVEHKYATTSTGNYSRLLITSIMKRELGYYIMQIYLPSGLIVLVSFVSFWISRDASVARVQLGVMTVLTMAMIMGKVNKTLPKVSYVKSIDYYMITCFMLIFLTLIEYALVGYWNKKIRNRLDRKFAAGFKESYFCLFLFFLYIGRKYVEYTRSVSIPRQVISLIRDSCFYTEESESSIPTDDLNVNLRRDSIGLELEPEVEPEILIMTPRMCDDVTSARRNNFSKSKRNALWFIIPEFEDLWDPKPSSIDKLSRFLFPMTFLGLNIVYWMVLNHESIKRQNILIEKHSRL